MGPNGIHYTEIPLHIIIILYVSDGDAMQWVNHDPKLLLVIGSHHACSRRPS